MTELAASVAHGVASHDGALMLAAAKRAGPGAAGTRDDVLAATADAAAAAASMRDALPLLNLSPPLPPSAPLLPDGAPLPATAAAGAAAPPPLSSAAIAAIAELQRLDTTDEGRLE